MCHHSSSCIQNLPIKPWPLCPRPPPPPDSCEFIRRTDGLSYLSSSMSFSSIRPPWFDIILPFLSSPHHALPRGYPSTHYPRCDMQRCCPRRPRGSVPVHLPLRWAHHPTYVAFRCNWPSRGLFLRRSAKHIFVGQTLEAALRLTCRTDAPRSASARQ